MDDSWHWITSAITDQPSEIDYIFANWTHYEIARQYGIKVAKNAPTEKS